MPPRSARRWLDLLSFACGARTKWIQQILIVQTIKDNSRFDVWSSLHQKLFRWYEFKNWIKLRSHRSWWWSQIRRCNLLSTLSVSEIWMMVGMQLMRHTWHRVPESDCRWKERVQMCVSVIVSSGLGDLNLKLSMKYIHPRILIQCFAVTEENFF